jgi:hypothetical protein
MFDNMNFRVKILAAMIVVVLLFIIYQACISVSRIGENRVVIDVVPTDSKITVNSKPVPADAVYLGPGNYTISGSKEGWKTDTQSIKMKKSSVSIFLIPVPESDQAKALASEPDIRRQREDIGSKLANSKGQQIENQNPLISDLPYTSLEGPFSIDYGPSTTRTNGVVYVISNSSPDGRQNALRWIKEHGQDPTDLQIEYDGFVNPLMSGGGG